MTFLLALNYMVAKSLSLNGRGGILIERIQVRIYLTAIS